MSTSSPPGLIFLYFKIYFILDNIFSATRIAKKLAVFIKILNKEDVSKLRSQEMIIEVKRPTTDVISRISYFY